MFLPWHVYWYIVHQDVILVYQFNLTQVDIIFQAILTNQSISTKESLLLMAAASTLLDLMEKLLPPAQILKNWIWQRMTFPISKRLEINLF